MTGEIRVQLRSAENREDLDTKTSLNMDKAIRRHVTLLTVMDSQRECVFVTYVEYGYRASLAATKT